MATATRDVSLELGDHYFRQQRWQEAADAYRRALQVPGQAEGSEALIGLACALRFTDASTAETLAAFDAARPVGLDDPQFWLVSVRYFLHTYARREPSVVAARSVARPFESLYLDALDDIEHGVGRFSGLVASRDLRCYPWGIALVQLAGWMETYIHPRRHEAGAETYPYRRLAGRLYTIVLESGIDGLVAEVEPGLAGDIVQEVTGPARDRQEAQARAAERPASLPWYRDAGNAPLAWPIGIVVILGVLMLVAQLLADSSILTSAIDLALSSLPANSSRG
jgi:hypothetical protein